MQGDLTMTAGERMRANLGPLLALSFALGAAACMPVKGLNVPTALGQDPATATGAKRAGTAAGELPLGLSTGLPMRASPPPAALLAPPSEVPASAAPTPTPTPLPQAPTGLTAAHEALKPILQKKLLNIAQVGFTRAQAGLIANNSGTLLSNNSAGIIANNSGSLISNNGGGYRVMQSAASISFEVLAGEELAFDHVWPDNRRYRVFRPAGAPDYLVSRQVYTNPAGAPIREIFRKVSTMFEDGKPKDYESGQMLQADDGRLLMQFGYLVTSGDDKGIATVTVLPNTSRWKDDVGGIHIEVPELVLNYPADTGSFKYIYPRLNQVETGTQTNLRKGADGHVTINLLEPFESNDGESRMESSTGELLYKRKVETVDGKRVSTFDLGDEIVMRLDGKSGADETGELLVEGLREAYVRLEQRADGSRIFIVTFAEDPTHPMVIGYGILDSAAMPSPSPKPAAWKVLTAAGAESGFQNGAGTVARFKGVTALVPSRVTPNRFYAVDSGNNVIRTMDVAADGALTFETYAGTGAASTTEGPRLEATFNRPFGLAADEDDTLYVSEMVGNRIRKIAPDGTVSTFAGSGTAGVHNAKGTEAWFYQPTGLALAPDKTLYVAEFGSQLIRKVAPDGTTASLAGGIYLAGTTDGTGNQARFNRPSALVVDASGNVIVADRDNLRLRKVTPQGAVTTIAGGHGLARFFWDGPALDIGIGYPRALCFDPAGKLFMGATNVRQLRDDGRLTSYAGLHLTGHADANHDEAYFSNIQGLAFGPKGVLYVADGTRIRAIVPPSPAP